MRKIIICVSILLVILLCACETDMVKKPESKTVAKVEVKTENEFEKYAYECNNMGDHTKHDYELQQSLMDKCQAKCCNGKYCDDCNWPGYGDCYDKCESNAPDGMCVNCDGYCWGKGHLEFLNNKISSC